jgi:hypothetical protein
MTTGEVWFAIVTTQMTFATRPDASLFRAWRTRLGAFVFVVFDWGAHRVEGGEA